MKKLNILLLFILFSCSYPDRDIEVENQINHIASTRSEDVTLDFNQIKPEQTWDSLIVYTPYSPVNADYNFRIGLNTKIKDIKQTDFYVTVGFLQNSKLTSYALVDRNPDLLQVLPPNKPYVIYGRNEAMFNIKKNPR